jgi:DNA-binding XRE family transcriptional regulator
MKPASETDTVTIPREEYDRLVRLAEDAEDIAAAGDALQTELIPAAFANRILDGESPLTVYREFRGLSKSALAARSGVNRVQIADIEVGRKAGSVATLGKLAAALGLSIDDIVSPTPAVRR